MEVTHAVEIKQVHPWGHGFMARQTRKQHGRHGQFSSSHAPSQVRSYHNDALPGPDLNLTQLNSASSSSPSSAPFHSTLSIKLSPIGDDRETHASINHGPKLNLNRSLTNTVTKKPSVAGLYPPLFSTTCFIKSPCRSRTLLAT